MEIGLAAFDMDGTLTQGRLVFELAGRFDLVKRVSEIQSSKKDGYLQTKAIAALFAGISSEDLESAVLSIPLTKNTARVIASLKERKCRVGIISDSYTAAALVLSKMLGMDFVAANDLEFANGRITGQIDMPLGWEKIGCFCKISVCKRYHLEEHARRFGVPIEKTMAVGDTRSDLCMVQRAGIGVAFMPKDDAIAKASKYVVQEPDMLKVLEFAT